MSPGSKSLDRDACRAYLDEATFKYRPSEYAKRYPKWPGSVGLEIEMLPVRTSAASPFPLSVKLQGPGDSTAAILSRYAATAGHRTELTEDDNGDPLLLAIFMDEGDNISFEPGGQVEFSSAPYPCLSDAIRRMREVQKTIDETLAPAGIKIVQVGIDPWHPVPELGLQMAKARYRAMDAHFASIGTYGQRMMRQTCTVQVNLDFGTDDVTLAKRYLGSQLFAPLAAATFAYSPVVDRKRSGVVGFRTRIWRQADNSRTGLPGLERLVAEHVKPASDGRTARDVCIDTYLDFVLGARVVFVTSLGYKNPAKPLSFGEWLERPIDGARPTLEDFKTHLTLMFPEVRPRGFLELRSIDCQPRAFQSVPASYATGLLYDPRSLDRMIELLLPRAAELPNLLERAEGGLSDATLASLSRQVMEIAAQGFSSLPPCFKAENSERELAVFREHFTQRGRTPGDDMLDRMAQKGEEYPSLATIGSLEDEWARSAT